MVLNVYQLQNYSCPLITSELVDSKGYFGTGEIVIYTNTHIRMHITQKPSYLYLSLSFCKPFDAIQLHKKEWLPQIAQDFPISLQSLYTSSIYYMLQRVVKPGVPFLDLKEYVTSLMQATLRNRNCIIRNLLYCYGAVAPSQNSQERKIC